MQSRFVPAVSIIAAGATLASGAGSARVAIPVDGSGGTPRYVRIGATVAAYVRGGDVTVVAAAGDALVQPGDPLYLAVKGFTHIATIQVTAPGVVSVVPLEDQ